LLFHKRNLYRYGSVANATNNHDLDGTRLMIAEAVVGKGTFSKRVSIHGRGRSGTMTHPRSHVRITVMETDKKVKRKVSIKAFEAPWKKHRRAAMLKLKMAQEAGLA
jgi:hypothetical protein